MATGKQLSKTNALPVSFSIYCSFTGNGVFSNGNTAYATLINDTHNSTYELITVNPFSGEVKQTAWIKQDSSIHTTLETLSTLYYLPPTTITKGGFLIYVYEYVPVVFGFAAAYLQYRSVFTTAAQPVLISL